MHTHKHTFTHERVRKSTHGRHTAPRSRIHTPSATRCTAAIRAPRSHIHTFTHSPHDDARPPPFTHSPSPQLDARAPPRAEITNSHAFTHSHAVRNSTHGRHHTHIHTHSPSSQLDARPPPHVEITHPTKSTHGRHSAHTTHRRIRRTTARPPTMRLARVVFDATRVWSRRAPPASYDPLVGPPQ